MKITLAEAVNLKSIVGKRLIELQQERTRAAVVKVAKKGDEIEVSERTLDEITAELTEARTDIRQLGLLLATANLANTVVWDGVEIPLTVALELAKQLRGEVAALKGFGNYKKEEQVSERWSGESFFQVTTFEPKEYKAAALTLDRQVNKLSSDLNHKNYTIQVEFPAAVKYIS